ncbi:MAG: sugar ABC transporter ATP-binding protein [Halomonas sp.]|uniref:sugar ABC transporter ATP-binding protein n=1 Tax=Halomonas TaxID=2745 RepID=UPI000EE9F699|nr:MULTISPECIES: sugar ABC transporter ATP-binding protein [Halomonas]HCR96479.1 sugar ABC transporter ATP-binding protein [Halomonas sp.]
MQASVLDIQGIHKSFGNNQVLRGIDMHINAGEVVVLMGANGAGKSTLVKVLSGYHAADHGQMQLAGMPYHPRDAREAIHQGVVTVHQSIDDGVIPDLDVANNLMLDRLASGAHGLWVSAKKLRQQASEVADAMGLDIDLNARVADLSVADRQMISIARAMAHAPRLLILDEPTSSLSASEAERLFTVIDRLRAQGVAIMYISHRMSDIRRLADRIICLRDGQISGVFDQAPLDLTAAVHAMLGQAIKNADIEPATPGAPILTLQSVELAQGAAPVSLSVGDGEIVAFAGLLGSGMSALVETLFGLRSLSSGTMQVDGQPYAPANVREALARGVFMSVKDRATNGVIGDFNIADNMTLPFLKAFTRGAFLSARQQRASTEQMIAQLGIVCQSHADSIGTLSGGNQQKVMIGRWLQSPSRVLLLDEPFQGVDIGARQDIGRHIRATAKGRATLVFVSELDEAIEIADRIIVLHEGAIAGEQSNRDIDLNALVAQASGKA